MALRTFPVKIRNTPTCVGKTRAMSSPSTAGLKHPHVRGEDCILQLRLIF